jgi:hypothetical protein
MAMDLNSETLMRSMIHDMANTLSGVRGILDLSDPMRPLAPKDRVRLEAVIADGMTVLERARHLAMGTLPDAAMETGEDWRARLEEMLGPLGALFRCRILLDYQGDPTHDRWPGDLLRGYIHAMARQVLPYVEQQELHLTFWSNDKEWRISWNPASGLPNSLAHSPEDYPKDTSARWAILVGDSVGAKLGFSHDTITVSIPKF